MQGLEWMRYEKNPDHRKEKINSQKISGREVKVRQKKSTLSFYEEKSSKIIPSHPAIPFLENISRSQVRFVSADCLWCLSQLINQPATGETSGQLNYFYD